MSLYLPARIARVATISASASGTIYGQIIQKFIGKPPRRKCGLGTRSVPPVETLGRPILLASPESLLVGERFAVAQNKAVYAGRVVYRSDAP